MILQFALFLFPDQKQIMMRNEIHRQKQQFTRKNINLCNEPQPSIMGNTPFYSDHRSICYIQLTDYSENSNREVNPCFRTTFFSKIGKRISPKKNFYKTMLNKFEESTSQEKIKHKKTQRNQEKQFSAAKQLSQRANFFIKKMNESDRASDKQRCNNSKSRQQSIRQNESNISITKNQQNLIDDIQRLRYSENSFLRMLKDKSFHSKSNIVNIQLQENFENKDIFTMQNTAEIISHFSRQTKQNACLRLREKIKNKQSRKHIYHSLKSKCDNWNKIRLKTQQHFNFKQKASFSAIQECQQTRLHYKKISHHPKNIQGIVIKPKFKPFFDNSNPLKIISKPCIISLNSYMNSETVQSTIKEMYISSQRNPESPKLDSKQTKTKKEVYQQIISSLNKNKKDCFFGRCKTGQKSIQRNEFRLLTPWKADNDDGY